MASSSLKNYHKNDFFSTPVEVRSLLLSLVNKEKIHTVLDPCVGRGDLLDTKSFTYKSYDLVKYDGQPSDTIIKSFLDTTSSDVLGIDAVIMNPPFSLTGIFVQHCIDIGIKEIFIICPISSLREFKRFIVDFKGDSSLQNKFAVTFPLGCFHLTINREIFGGYGGKYNYLYSKINKRPLTSWKHYDCTDPSQNNGLVFRPTLLGTYHNFQWIDPRTNFEGWCTPVDYNTPKEVKSYLTYYPHACIGHKQGEKRDTTYFLPVPIPNLYTVYMYFVEKYAASLWYKCQGINSAKSIDTWYDINTLEQSNRICAVSRSAFYIKNNDKIEESVHQAKKQLIIDKEDATNAI